LSGFCAGVFGAAINTPGDTVRTVIQKRMLGNQPGAIGFVAVANEIMKSRGVGGLYAGFNFKAFHLGGGGALMAFFLPFFKKVFAVPQ
jgi:solute carrier family 25 (mitochondrial 2-oxodicarboxylate transporter), member 21